MIEVEVMQTGCRTTMDDSDIVQIARQKVSPKITEKALNAAERIINSQAKKRTNEFLHELKKTFGIISKERIFRSYHYILQRTERGTEA